MTLKTVAPDLKMGHLAFSPRRIPSLAPAAGGLDLHLPGYEEVDFAAISPLAVFSAGTAGGSLYLLLFVAGERRPFQVAAERIQFRRFPIAEQPTVPSHLREFLFYLLQQIPEPTIDESTYHYLQGQLPQHLEDDALALATALGELAGADG